MICYTQDSISGGFRHGAHSGQFIEDIVEMLVDGSLRPTDAEMKNNTTGSASSSRKLTALNA